MSIVEEEFEDSVVGDVRRVRAQIAAECGNDVEKLCRKLMEDQAKHPERLVSLHGRRKAAERRLTITEARRRLGDVVRDAEQDRATVITRRGKPVAVVMPYPQRMPGPLPDLTEFRSSIKAKGKPLSETVIDSRREMRC